VDRLVLTAGPSRTEHVSMMGLGQRSSISNGALEVWLTTNAWIVNEIVIVCFPAVPISGLR
jgi:hypothetical protein